MQNRADELLWLDWFIFANQRRLKVKDQNKHTMFQSKNTIRIICRRSRAVLGGTAVAPNGTQLLRRLKTGETADGQSARWTTEVFIPWCARRTLRQVLSFLLTLTRLGLWGVAGAAASEVSVSQAPETLRPGFINPGNDYRALPMGLGQRSKPEEYVKRVVQGGWGGGNLWFPIQGQGYLRDHDGWKTYQSIVQGFRERGLKCWLYDESGYPSGRARGQVLAGHPEFEARGLFYASQDVRGRDGEQPCQIEWSLPEGTPFYVARYALDAQGRLAGQAVDLTGAVESGRLKVTVPPGTWRLMAFVQNRLFAGTHASLTGGPYINVLDPDAVKRFIQLTHEAYYAHVGADFGKTIMAAFTDEVSLMSGVLTEERQPFPAIAWYHGLPALFRHRTGYDIRQCLPALFEEVGADTVRMRCDFYALLGRQVADAYFKQVRKWCFAHRIASTGHLLWEESLIYHANFYGTMFPAYQELDWPGIDVLGCRYGCTSGSATEGGPVTPKLASSVAHLGDKPRTMSESFCFVSSKTPIEELLAHYNWQAVLGINKLTTLSIQKAYSPAELGKFNDYVGRLNYMLTQGQFRADVAVLYPIASVWAGFRPMTRHVRHLEDNPQAREVDEAWREVSAQVLACQRDFDYIDESSLQGATVVNGELIVGRKNCYSVLVLPHVTTLEFATVKQIQQFVEKGGTVIAWQTLPWNRADAGSADEHRALVQEIWNHHQGRVIKVMTDTALRQTLMGCGKPDLVVTPATDAVYYQHRLLPRGDMFFLVNNSQAPVSGEFAFRAGGKAELWNPLTGQTSFATPAQTIDGSKLTLTLSPRKGLFVVFSHDVELKGRTQITTPPE